LDDYLLAKGTNIIEKSQDNKSRQQYKYLTDQSVANLDRYSNSLKIINWLTSKTDENLISPKLTVQQSKNKNLQEVIRLFVENKLCEYDNRQIYFRSEESHFISMEAGSKTIFLIL